MWCKSTARSSTQARVTSATFRRRRILSQTLRGLRAPASQASRDRGASSSACTHNRTYSRQVGRMFQTATLFISNINREAGGQSTIQDDSTPLFGTRYTCRLLSTDRRATRLVSFWAIAHHCSCDMQKQLSHLNLCNTCGPTWKEAHFKRPHWEWVFSVCYF